MPALACYAAPQCSAEHVANGGDVDVLGGAGGTDVDDCGDEGVVPEVVVAPPAHVLGFGASRDQHGGGEGVAVLLLGSIARGTQSGM